MNKKQFYAFLEDGFSSDDLNKEIAFLNKVKDIWLPELISSKTKDYLECDNCNRYIKLKDYIYESKQVISKDECIFRDAGYGEDDEYADVTYLVRYRICPKCRNRQIISKTHLKTENVRRRYEYK